jgi:hypothetical protein
MWSLRVHVFLWAGGGRSGARCEGCLMPVAMRHGAPRDQYGFPYGMARLVGMSKGHRRIITSEVIFTSHD